MLGCGIHSQKRHDSLGSFAAYIYERAAILFQVRQGSKRTIDDTPEVSIEKTPAVGFVDFVETSINCYTCVIDPGIDATKTVDRGLCREMHFFPIGNIRDNIDSRPSRV